MDELKLTLGPSFLRKLVAQILNKIIRKKLGCDMDILINEIHVTTGSNGKTRIHADLDAEITNEALTNLIKQNNLI